MTLDLTAVRDTIVQGLPLKARWVLHETPMDFDFSWGHGGLRHLERSWLTFEPTDASWFGLLLFGEYDYSEGGGARPFLCIRESDGAIYGLDVERDRDALFVLNSSIGRYVETFRYLHHYLSRPSALPADLLARVQAIDPEAYPASEWRDLALYVAEAE